jgi:hypothetical protein
MTKSYLQKSFALLKGHGQLDEFTTGPAGSSDDTSDLKRFGLQTRSAKRALPLGVHGWRRLAWAVRKSLRAEIRVVRCTPKRSRSRLRNRMRRVTCADSSMRPPSHGHIAAVDRMEAALGMLPITAICAVRLDGKRFGGDAFAAPLPAPRLRPVGGFFGTYRCLRRMPSADPFVFPELAPESARGAIGGSDRLVSHNPSLGPAGLLREIRRKAGRACRAARAAPSSRCLTRASDRYWQPIGACATRPPFVRRRSRRSEPVTTAVSRSACAT